MVPVIQLSVDFKIMKVYKVLLRIFSKMSNSETEEAQGLAMDCPVWREADNSLAVLYLRKKKSVAQSEFRGFYNKHTCRFGESGIGPTEGGWKFREFGNFRPRWLQVLSHAISLKSTKEFTTFSVQFLDRTTKIFCR